VYNSTNQTATVYIDGKVANSQQIPIELNVWTTNSVNGPLPIRVGAQNAADGSPSGPFATLTLARARVFDQALTDADIAQRFDAEKAAFAGSAPAQTTIENAKVDATGTTFSFTWSPVAGKTYGVESTTDFKSWAPANGSVGNGSFSEAITGSGRRFYRLRVQ
jgi:hypothetical protein